MNPTQTRQEPSFDAALAPPPRPAPRGGGVPWLFLVVVLAIVAYASTQPWTRYGFVDPQWQSLAAGQKMLLRMGADNRLRLKAKLREIRAAMLGPQAAAPR